jgi:predicted histone-like DNA-binding protein
MIKNKRVMALIIKKVQRRNLQDPQGKKLWYPVLKSLGVLKERNVAKKISDETTLNPKEAEMTLYQLPKVVIEGLLNGHTVHIGGLGTFRLTVSGKGMETEKEVDANSIKQVNIRYMPAVEVKEAIQKATFVTKDNI